MQSLTLTGSILRLVLQNKILNKTHGVRGIAQVKLRLYHAEALPRHCLSPIALAKADKD